jgi:hypothetical protein
MSKRVFLMVAILCLLFSSCVSSKGPTPYGKWENSVLGVVMDINPELEEHGFYPGEYRNYMAATENLLIQFASHMDSIMIYNMDEYILGEPLKEENLLFSGTFSVKDNKLYFALSPGWVESTGLDTITFEKVEDY